MSWSGIAREPEAAERRRRERREMRELLRLNPLLPLDIILNPYGHPGETVEGERWDHWAVRVKEEAALAILVRPEYRQGRSAADPQGIQLLSLALGRHPRVAERAWNEYRELLLLPSEGFHLLLHDVVVRWPRIAHLAMAEEEMAFLTREGASLPVAAVAIRWPEVAERMLRERPEWLKRPAGNPLAFRCLEMPSSFVRDLLLVPGVLEIRDRTGRSLGERVLEEERSLHLVGEYLSLLNLPYRGAKMAHWVARTSEPRAVSFIESRRIAQLRDEAGESVAHVAVRAFGAAADRELAVPSVAGIRNARGETVREAALQAFPALEKVVRLDEALQAEMERQGHLPGNGKRARGGR